jgi:Cu2+-exporting ATPase
VRTTTVDIRDLVTPLDPLVAEKRLRAFPGVLDVAASFASGSATVTYNEAVTDVARLRQAVRDCGFHCRGEVVPKHVCTPGEDAAAPGNPRGPERLHPAHHAHAAHAAHERVARAGGAKVVQPMEKAAHAAHDMAGDMAEMGHGPGMDMQAMARDMRNRFLVALVFTIPIFFLAPMGMDVLRVKPPFGWDLNITLFVLASAAILHLGGAGAATRCVQHGGAGPTQRRDRLSVQRRSDLLLSRGTVL